ncbi:hypothetical protein Tco_0190621 [Tanacetum coccineum]
MFQGQSDLQEIQGTTSVDKMLLMHSPGEFEHMDEEQSLFLAGEQVTNVDDDVDDTPENDLALNVDHVFEADECDAFDSDVDEGPTSQTMFMANLTSKDPIYDEARPSYDSNNSFEVQDHDTFVDHMDEYHEVHEMQNDVQSNSLFRLYANIRSDSQYYSYVTGHYNVHTVIHDSEDTRELAEITRNRMLLKMQSPLCMENKVRIAPPPITSKEDFLQTLLVPKNLTPEQIFWSIDDKNRKRLRPELNNNFCIDSCMPPTTPCQAFPRILPTISQVMINLLCYCTTIFTENLTKLAKLEFLPQQEAPDFNSFFMIKNGTQISRKGLIMLKMSTALIDQNMIDLELETRKDSKSSIAVSNDSNEAKRIKRLEAIQKKNRIRPAKKENMKEVEDPTKIGEPKFKLLQLDVFKCRSYRSVSWVMEDFVMGNSVISRVYYVGTWTQSILCRAFCDSDLSGLQKALLCFVRDSMGTSILKSIKGKKYIGHHGLTIQDSHGKGYRIYNKRTRRLMETIHVTFDEMHQSMAPVRMSTSLSTTIAQDAPSTSASSSTSDIHHPVQHQEISEEPTHEDTPINHDVLHPSHNLVTGDPDHLRRWTKVNPLDTSLAIPSVCIYQTIVSIRCFVVIVSYAELSKSEPKNFKLVVVEMRVSSHVQVMEIHEFDRLEVWNYLKGFEDQENPTSRLSLKKALYGLKQAPRACLCLQYAGSCGISRFKKKYVGVLSFLEIDWLAGHQRSKEARQYQLQRLNTSPCLDVVLKS